MKKAIIYSCKRKKDYVTLSALTMLSAIVLFELYLILILPIQLSTQNALKNNVARQRMTTLADNVRFSVFMFTQKKINDPLNAGEIVLVLTSMDRLAYYLRNNQRYLNGRQIRELQETFVRFNHMVDLWNAGNFRIRYKEFNTEPILKKMEKELINQQKARKNTL